ncbi:MAG: PhoH family protein [Sandaracinaceae bacterium]
MARTVSSRPAKEQSITADLEVSEPELILRLTGPTSTTLRVLEREYGVQLGVRGTTILLRGDPERVAGAQRALAELLGVFARGDDLSEGDVERAVRTLRHDPEVRLSDYMDDAVLVAPRRTIVPKSIAQKVYVHSIRTYDVTFGIGPAGTGKTYLAMAMAVRALTEGKVQRIILTRPAVEAGEKLGFLPGDLAEKVNPYLRPLYDALHEMMDMERVQALISRGSIEVAPLAFMRGRTLNASFVILDEAQNSTTEQMKMFLTRLGFDSKAVITGDVTQTDLPTGRKSGLADATRLLADIDGIAICHFSDQDVVRHPLVARIVRAYERREERIAAEREALATAPDDQPDEPPEDADGH